MFLRSPVLILALLLASSLPAQDDPTRHAIESLQGDWNLVRLEFAGQDATAPFTPKDGKPAMTVRGNRMIFTTESGAKREMLFTLDTASRPAGITLTLTENNQVTTYLGIYKLDKDQLTLCLDDERPSRRPTEFKTERNKRTLLQIMNRARP